MPKSKKDNALETIPDEEEVIVVSGNADQDEPSRAGKFLVRALGFILRLALFLIFIAALGAGIYFGLPILNEKYVRPVEINSSQLSDLTKQQALNENQIAEMKTQLAALEAAQSSQAAPITDLSARVAALEESIAMHDKSLSTLAKIQASLQASDEESQVELVLQIKKLKSMELLSRARLFLYQSNFGLARADVQTARDLLAEIQPDESDLLDAEIAQTITRLDLVLKNLPSFPVAASDDLDIAWQILLGGIPPQELVTPVPELDATPTP